MFCFAAKQQGKDWIFVAIAFVVVDVWFCVFGRGVCRAVCVCVVYKVKLPHKIK